MATPLSMTQTWDANVCGYEYRCYRWKEYQSREELVYYPKSHVFVFRDKLFLGYSYDEGERHYQVAVPTDGPIYDLALLKVELYLPPYSSDDFGINMDHYRLILSVKKGRSSLQDPSLWMRLMTFRPTIRPHMASKYFFTDCVRFIQLRIRALVTRMKAERLLAVLMGGHPRLGSYSLFNLLDDDVLRLIVAI
jgi:hypothetical protein